MSLVGNFRMTQRMTVCVLRLVDTVVSTRRKLDQRILRVGHVLEIREHLGKQHQSSGGRQVVIVIVAVDRSDGVFLVVRETRVFD